MWGQIFFFGPLLRLHHNYAINITRALPSWRCARICHCVCDCARCCVCACKHAIFPFECDASRVKKGCPARS